MKRLGEGGAADAFAAAAEIEKLLVELEPPRGASYRVGDARLTVAEPEQARPELLRAIARDVAQTRAGLGPTARVALTGLERPIGVRASGPREVELFIEYTLAVDLK